MSKFGHPLDIEGLLSFQGNSYFRCYEIEANASISTNVHVLGALLQTDQSQTYPFIDMVKLFLENARVSGAYWVDKWHISPYYTTAHAIIASSGLDRNFVEPAVDWILKTQHHNGGWGYYIPTPEETAYAIQSLAIWKRSGGKVPISVLRKGKDWLEEHAYDQQPFLWIGKSLYKPTLVIHTAILSALALVDKEL
jgi:halimadienyl-diphosphate synthase